jgi:hypothetical protein
MCAKKGWAIDAACNKRVHAKDHEKRSPNLATLWSSDAVMLMLMPDRERFFDSWRLRSGFF